MPTHITHAPIDPHLRPWMLFVDGENFTLRGQEFAGRSGVLLKPGPSYSRDEFLWLPQRSATQNFADFAGHSLHAQPNATRAYYYTSVVGDDDHVRIVREALWELGFQPSVYKKSRRETKAKGVDIALAKDFLSHAYLGNYDVAILVAGDGDYVPLLEEAKRLGCVVYVAFFANSGLSSELRLSSDGFIDMAPRFLAGWNA